MRAWVAAAAVAAIGCGGGGSGPSGPDAPPAVKQGSFIAQSFVPQGGVVSAVFFTRAGEICTDTRMGACVLHACTADPLHDAGAGILTIEGGALPVTITDPGDHFYTNVLGSHALFAGGERLVFTASGGDVPAFSTSLTAPTHATVTAPVKPAAIDASIAIDRTRPFEVSWTGGAPGLVSVLLIPQAMPIHLECRYSASLGSASIPSDVLALLPAGSGRLYIRSVAASPVRVADWDIVASALYDASWAADGTFANAPITLQ